MTVRLVAIAFDAADPHELARFWSRALRWEISETADADVELVPTDVTTFRLVIRRGAEPKRGQNRIHFDLTTTSPEDRDTTVADLLASGATPADVGQGPDVRHVVLADPEGNELCVIEPEDRFLASCPRLGAVNCDGTRALGQFWSAALDWPLVWDRDEETAIQAPDGTGPKITWSGPPLMPRHGRERLHLHVAPVGSSTAGAAAVELASLGATRLDAESAPGCPGAIALADVDGNPLCVVERPPAA